MVFIFRDINTTGDGIVSAVQLLRCVRESGKPLSELRKALVKFPQAQRNVRVTAKPALEELGVSSRLAEIEEELDGAGRLLLRYSGTEPLLRILVEGKNEEAIEAIADELADAIAGEIGDSA